MRRRESLFISFSQRRKGGGGGGGGCGERTMVGANLSPAMAIFAAAAFVTLPFFPPAEASTFGRGRRARGGGISDIFFYLCITEKGRCGCTEYAQKRGWRHTIGKRSIHGK